MNSTEQYTSATLTVARLVSMERNTMTLELVSGAQSATTVRSWAEYKNLDLATAKQVISTALMNKQIATNSGALITRTLEDAIADEKVCYTYRMLGTLTEQFSKTSYSKQVISAALYVHTAIFAPKEQAKNKARKTDTPQATTTVRTSRTTQTVNTSRNISVPYADSEEQFISVAREMWAAHTSLLEQEAQTKRNAQVVEVASSLNTAAAALGLSVEQIIALAQEIATKQAAQSAQDAAAAQESSAE